ncbi:MAG: hypothetical protein FWD54_04510 [Endomicrobia bacterium]|nr:hypothetical protein [Endomicrobiia bacterium]
MLSNVEVYKIWAQDNALWTEWVKPVSFANMRRKNFEGLSIPKADWVLQSDRSAAIIVDLPGKDGVLEGLALAHIGYRPVPLYNGVRYYNASKMIVPVHEIEDALYNGAVELSGLRISLDAPPAFLLDSNRMSGRVISGEYDNRWSIFPQDMPSASYLIGKGIRNVIVRTDIMRNDLEHILYKYQSLGITIYMDDGVIRRAVKVSKPSKFRNLFYRFSVIMGLRRNPAGGFGGMVPEESSGGYG